MMPCILCVLAAPTTWAIVRLGFAMCRRGWTRAGMRLIRTGCLMAGLLAP